MVVVIVIIVVVVVKVAVVVEVVVVVVVVVAVAAGTVLFCCGLQSSDKERVPKIRALNSCLGDLGLP